ncbi:MAG: ATP-dependent RecD-like DNA helicase [Defluviitaleaceae bacterium]|nr:ATP-dependent RecD-like DNA helicase [Defluviitaleaceae bacterium]
MTEITGSIEHIIYRDDKSGYTVFEVLSTGEHAHSRITCTANSAELTPGENVRLMGDFVVHQSYGSQFKAVTVERRAPTTVAGISKYLVSSIKGVGERMAERITDMYGTETFEIIEKYPEMLAKIPGISVKKATEISVRFGEQSTERHVMMYLQQFGISQVYITRIYKRYKAEAVDIVRKNPYRIADEIVGIGFKTADKIAEKVGIPLDSEYRTASGIKYILSEAAQSGGHVYLEKDDLAARAEALLASDAAPFHPIDNILHNMQFSKQIYQERDENTGAVLVYLNKYFHQESYVAMRLTNLCGNIKALDPELESDIAIFEEANDIALSDCQKEAIISAHSHGVMVITGGPGTGKTTVINALISLFEKRGLSVELTAPTGRAAKRMEEATGHEAKTIHRLLGINGGDPSSGSGQVYIDRDDKNPLECNVLIVDESSMVDITLIYYLLRAAGYNMRLILVGDADQLPSVGPGNVLKDIIRSEKIPVARLRSIFRQSEGSNIITNAHKINDGELPYIGKDSRDFFFASGSDLDGVQNTIVTLVRERLPGYAKANPIMDIQILTPMRKSALGADNLNVVLQQALNPPTPYKNELEYGTHIYREGDKIMQIKNNYNLAWVTEDGRSEGIGVYNGDGGVILHIDSENDLLRARMDGGRIIDYDTARLDEIALSYAVTIHKSQGSEYRVVVIPLFGGPPMLLTRNLLYTAVTRAKELVVIVGSKNTMKAMVGNNREMTRYSALARRIGME